jgi:hypothetical protein
MSTIDDVIAWAISLPAWQSDAVRRLLAAGEQPLSAKEYSEILALAKAHMKVASAPETLKAIPPAVGKLSGVPTKTVCIKLLSIDNVHNVNIIKPGQTLPFSENGVTVARIAQTSEEGIPGSNLLIGIRGRVLFMPDEPDSKALVRLYQSPNAFPSFFLPDEERRR